MQFKLSDKVEKQGKKGTYVSATMTAEDGTVYKGVNAFHGEFAADTWHGELERRDNFWNLVTPKQNAGQNFARRQQSEEIKKTAFEIQQNISENVAKAQDRTAWMWAKNNAAELLKGDSRLYGRNSDEIASMVITLATKIYNGEPTEPFSSPKSNYTSPSEEFPNGMDMYNHPLTTDTERAKMDDMSNIPF